MFQKDQVIGPEHKDQSSGQTYRPYDLIPNETIKISLGKITTNPDHFYKAEKIKRDLRTLKNTGLYFNKMIDYTMKTIR